MHAVSSLISSRFGKFFTLFAALTLSATFALGQAATSTSDLSGTVVDPNDAVVAGATVTARNLATGLSRCDLASGLLANALLSRFFLACLLRALLSSCHGLVPCVSRQMLPN